jgi:2,3-bisphosphoglycerate-dependent phosphoglycerate mutase
MAKRVKEWYPPEMIWASTLKRAKETASTLAKRIGCPVQFEADLMEINNGVQAGLSFEEAKKYPEPKLLHERLKMANHI